MDQRGRGLFLLGTHFIQFRALQFTEVFFVLGEDL